MRKTLQNMATKLVLQSFCPGTADGESAGILGLPGKSSGRQEIQEGGTKTFKKREGGEEEF